MAKALSPWCKQVKIAMIDLDLTPGMLAEKIGISRQWVTAVISGRAHSDGVMKEISDELGISESVYSVDDELSTWCKQAKKVMIENDITVTSLAEKIGMTREYTSSVLNGKVYTESSVKAISDVLNITPR